VPFCEVEPPEPAKYVLSEDDILISRAGSVGFSTRIRGDVPPAVFASYLIRFRVSEGVDPGYVQWFLQTPSYWTQIGRASVGIALANVNAKKLAAVTLPLAPLAEQRRIVAAIEEQFSRLDAVDRTLSTVQLRLARMPMLVLHQALSRFEKHVPLREIADVRLGRQRSPKNHFGPDMTPYLRAANVTWAGLNLSDVKSMNFAPDEVDTYRLEPGDVLLSEASGSAGEVGKTAIWQGEIEICCFQNTLIRVRSQGPRPEFLRLVFLHAALTGQFAQAAPGVGIHHLGAGRLGAWPTPVASEQEQAGTVAFVEQQLSLIDALRAAVESAQKRSAVLRRAILERAFRGELVRQDPDDEPASVLLERIRAECAAAPKPKRRRRVTA
jgi:type I restriction enzyme S subunit